MREVEIVLLVEEAGDPVKIEPPDGVCKELAEQECPCRALGYQLAEGDLARGFVLVIGLNDGEFLGRDELMAFGEVGRAEARR